MAWNGKAYNSNKWDTNSAISATWLNNMESGIGINTANALYLKNQVDSLSGKNNTLTTNISGLINSLDDLDMTVDNLNVRLGIIEDYDISPNLFDKTKAVTGLLSNNGIVNSSDTWSGYITSDFIPVQKDVDYYDRNYSQGEWADRHSITRYAYYSSKNESSMLGYGTITGGTLLSGNGLSFDNSNIKYIRFSIPKDRRDTLMFTKNNDELDGYYQYGAAYLDGDVKIEQGYLAGDAKIEQEKLIEQHLTNAEEIDTWQKLVNALNTGGEYVLTSNITRQALPENAYHGANHIITNDLIIHGCGYKVNFNNLAGNNNTPSSTCQQVFYVKDAHLTLDNCIFERCTGGIVIATGNSKVIVNNCTLQISSQQGILITDNSIGYIFNSNIRGIAGQDGDGINLKGNGKAYVEGCTINACIDEGITTHENSYIEVYNTEVYDCGYSLGINAITATKTAKGANSSYGGIHIGGSGMGIIKNCYSHDNATYGIGLYNISDAPHKNKVTCIGNIVTHNGWLAVSGASGEYIPAEIEISGKGMSTVGGIIVKGAHDFEIRSNNVTENASYGIRFGYDNIAPYQQDNNNKSAGIIVDNFISGNFTDTITIDENMDDGIFQSDFTDRLDFKADTDGEYNDLIAGASKQIIASCGEINNSVYTYRKTLNTAEQGELIKEKLVGGTIFWNQLATVSGVPSSDLTEGMHRENNWATNEIIFSGETNTDLSQNITSTYRKDVNGHVLYLRGCPEGGGLNNYYMFDSYNNSNNASVDIGNGKIYKVENNQGMSQAALKITVGIETSELIFRPELFDLTLIFGSEVAEFIYNLETETAGAGIQFFKNLFPNNYYYPNRGELLSTRISKRCVIGSNQWDEVWETGVISGDTGINSGTNGIRSKNYIPVLPNLRYCVQISNKNTGAMYTRWYDKDKKYIGHVPQIPIGTTSGVNPPPNAAYLRFYVSSNFYGGKTYKNDISLSIFEEGRQIAYKPYEEYDYLFNDGNGVSLLGIPKINSDDGTLYYDGDIYTGDGVIIRNYKSSSDFTYESIDNNQYKITIADMQPDSQIISNRYLTVSGTDLYGTFQDGETIQTLQSSTEVVYKLATPIVEFTKPYREIQYSHPYGTEYFVDGLVEKNIRSVPVPGGQMAEYLPNLRVKLENLPSTANTDGTYMISQTNGKMSLIPSMQIPPLDSITDEGDYYLKCYINASGVKTFYWAEESVPASSGEETIPGIEPEPEPT